jgi:hypothetical protein
MVISDRGGEEEIKMPDFFCQKIPTKKTIIPIYKAERLTGYSYSKCGWEVFFVRHLLSNQILPEALRIDDREIVLIFLIPTDQSKSRRTQLIHYRIKCALMQYLSLLVF